VKQEERANSEEQDVLYDIDPFPQYPISNQCLMLYYLSVHLNQSQEFLYDDFHYNQKVDVNQYAAHSAPPVIQFIPILQSATIAIKYAILPDTDISTTSQPQSQYTLPIKSEFGFVQNDNNFKVPNLAMQ
ncbi:4457_t:CDS:2, partial [Gigaspora margarita]